MQSQENVSVTLGLASPIVKIMKHEKENSRYTIFLENGTKIKLPNVSHLLSQARLRNSVALFTKTCINRIPNKNWQSVSQALLDLVEDGYQTTFEEQVMTWMREYLAYSTIHEDLDEYFRNNATGPFIYAGRAHIRLVPFMEWLAQRKGVKEPRRKITAALRENGILPAKLKIKIEDSFLVSGRGGLEFRGRQKYQKRAKKGKKRLKKDQKRRLKRQPTKTGHIGKSN